MQENQTCTFARKVGYLIKSETLIQNPKNNPHDQEWTFYLLVGNNNTLLTNSVFICVLQSQQFQQIIVTFTIHGLTLRAKLTVKYHTLFYFRQGFESIFTSKKLKQCVQFYNGFWTSSRPKFEASFAYLGWFVPSYNKKEGWTSRTMNKLLLRLNLTKNLTIINRK